MELTWLIYIGDCVCVKTCSFHIILYRNKVKQDNEKPFHPIHGRTFFYNIFLYLIPNSTLTDYWDNTIFSDFLPRPQGEKSEKSIRFPLGLG